MNTRINLQDPFQGRKWLRLIVPDERCGFKLKADASVSATDLGFSCTTNRLGLRGPCDEDAENVVFGTSFAMAVGVDDQDTWHHLALPRQGWLNLGLAVGIREWCELARMHHRGPKRRAIFIYHPNIWAHSLLYERWRASGQDVFAALNWRRDLPGCTLLAWRRWARRGDQIRSGRLIRFEHGGARYAIDAVYARVSPNEHRDLVRRNLDMLHGLLQPFDEVWCVRVPVKQQFVPADHVTFELRQTLSTYDALWEATSQRLQRGHLRKLRIVEPAIFALSHYYPNDSHWSPSGNAQFASWMRTSVMQLESPSNEPNAATPA